MGRVNGADDIDWNADINHRWTVPGAWFRGATVGVSTRGNLNFDGVRTNTGFSLFTRQSWRNFMTSSFNLNCQLRAESDVLTRGGPLMATPAGCDLNAGVNSSFAVATSWRVFANRFKTETGDWQFRVSAGLTLRPTSAKLHLHPEPHGRSLRRAVRGQRPIQRHWGTGPGPDSGAGRLWIRGDRRPERPDVFRGGPRLQRPLVPEQLGDAMGVAARQHPVFGLAAKPVDVLFADGPPSLPRIASTGQSGRTGIVGRRVRHGR